MALEGYGSAKSGTQNVTTGRYKAGANSSTTATNMSVVDLAPPAFFTDGVSEISNALLAGSGDGSQPAVDGSGFNVGAATHVRKLADQPVGDLIPEKFGDTNFTNTHRTIDTTGLNLLRDGRWISDADDTIYNHPPGDLVASGQISTLASATDPADTAIREPYSVTRVGKTNPSGI